MPQPTHRLRELKSQRARIAEQMRAIRTTAGTGELTAEQRTQFDALYAQQEQIKQDVEREERQLEVERELAGREIRGGRGRPGSGEGRGRDFDRDADDDESRDGEDDEREERDGEDDEREERGGRGGERRDARGARDAGDEDAWTELGVRSGAAIATAGGPRRNWRSILSRPEYRRMPGGGRDQRAADYRAAFRRYLQTGETRGLVAGTDPEGGFLVAPAQFAARLIQRVDDLVFMRQLATVEAVATSGELGMLSLDSDPDDFEWTSELSTGNDDDAIKFGRRMWKTHPLARRIKLSKTLLRRTGFDIEGKVLERFAYKKALVEERGFLLGNGVNQPLGLFFPSNQGVPTTRDVSEGFTATKYTYEGLVATMYFLKTQYRERASWLLPREGVKQAALMVDGDNRPLWQPSIQLGQPDRLLGKALRESEHVPNVFTASKYVGMFGDYSHYSIVDSLLMEIQRLVELYAEKNQIGYILRAETDGGPTLAEAFARMKLAAA